MTFSKLTFCCWEIKKEKKNNKKNMFIKVAPCLLWYLFCARPLVDAVLLAVIYAAFSGVCDLPWAPSLTRVATGEGEVTFNGCLTNIHLHGRSMTPLVLISSNQNGPLRPRLADENNARKLGLHGQICSKRSRGRLEIIWADRTVKETPAVKYEAEKSETTIKLTYIGQTVNFAQTGPK